jgi:hypothetical protein
MAQGGTPALITPATTRGNTLIGITRIGTSGIWRGRRAGIAA